MAEVLKPILEFRKYKMCDNAAMREFYSLLRASVLPLFYSSIFSQQHFQNYGVLASTLLSNSVPSFFPILCCPHVHFAAVLLSMILLSSHFQYSAVLMSSCPIYCCPAGCRLIFYFHPIGCVNNRCCWQRHSKMSSQNKVQTNVCKTESIFFCIGLFIYVAKTQT